MKKLLPFLCVVLAFCATAQTNTITPPPQLFNPNTPGLTIDSIIRYLQKGLTAADSGEGGRVSQIANFARLWRDRVTHNDSSGANMFQQYFRSAQWAALARTNASCNGGAFSGQWRIDGPDSFPTQNLGRMRDVWADPTDTNKLLASGDGGVWKTTDAGKKWQCITDNAPVLKGIISPNKLAVNPTNTDNFYVGSYAYPNHILYPQGMNYINGSINNANYGHGLLVTNDGGASWHQEILPKHTPPNWEDSVSGAKPYFSPDGQRVYAFRDNHLFYKPLSGAWQDITPSALLGTGSSAYFYELKFVPNAHGGRDPNHFFITQHIKGKLIECTYDPASQIHSFNRVLFPTPAMDTFVDGFYISIPTRDILYAAFGSDLWHYNIASGTWRFVNALQMVDFWSNVKGVWEGGFEASPVNPAILYLTNSFDRSFFSNDTGRTTQAISTYWGTPTHGDVRCIFVQQTQNNTNGLNDRVYYANDGGIMMKPSGVSPQEAGENTCININGKGLTAGKFWGVSSLEKDGTVFAGQADNHQWSFNPFWQQPWQHFGGGDGGEAVASRTEEKGYIGVSGNGYTDYFAETKSNSAGIFNSISGGFSVRQERINEIIPLWADQYGGYYVGQRNLWRVLPNSNTFVRVSGRNVPLAQCDVHLPMHIVGRDTIPIRAMSFSQYHDSLTGYVVYNDGALFYRNDLTTVGQNTNQFNLKPATGYDTMVKGFAYWNHPTDVACDPRRP